MHPRSRVDGRRAGRSGRCRSATNRRPSPAPWRRRRRRSSAKTTARLSASHAQLRPKPIYADETLGLSEVRALKALPGGRTLVVANKQNVLDYRNTGGGQDAYAMTDLQRSSSGLALILARDGKASPPIMVDTGRNVFLSAAEVEGPGRLVIGGSVGGGAALVRLTEGRR